MATNKEVRMASIKSEIINRVKAIAAQKEAKKNMNAAYTENIKSLEREKNKLLEDLEALQNQELTEAADEILAEDE